MGLSLGVLIISADRIAETVQTRLLNLSWRREQDAPEALPREPPKGMRVPMCHKKLLS
jgi:hypothetical protein